MAQCIGCTKTLPEPFLDLGETPLANSYVLPEMASEPEPCYPLRVAYCERCHLVQLTDLVPPEMLFSEYAYFSSYSDTVVAHGRRMAESLTDRFSLGPESRVLEIASNDGYLLRFFKERGIQVLGVEPASNIAQVANQAGIPTWNSFFGPELVPQILSEYGRADVIVANNVVAHVPQINEFLTAAAEVLKPDGCTSFEFPYLRELMAHREFDTIYHEHVSYFSLSAIQRLARRAKMELIDAELHPIHGGSVRVFLAHASERLPSSRVNKLLMEEEKIGLTDPDRYADFSNEVARVKKDLLRMLHTLKAAGKSIAAYGAPAKGNTLLNYCGIDTSLIEFTVDRSPHKQGKLLPGSRIPILAPEELLARQPDYTLILPWNISQEIVQQQQEYLERGGNFLIPVPHPAVLSTRPVRVAAGNGR
jgi:SAM-dependent methyltransferase